MRSPRAMLRGVSSGASGLKPTSGSLKAGFGIEMGRNLPHFAFNPLLGQGGDFGGCFALRVDCLANAHGDHPGRLDEGVFGPEFTGIVRHRYDQRASGNRQVCAARLEAVDLAWSNARAFVEDDHPNEPALSRSQPWSITWRRASLPALRSIEIILTAVPSRETGIINSDFFRTKTSGGKIACRLTVSQADWCLEMMTEGIAGMFAADDFVNGCRGRIDTMP